MSECHVNPDNETNTNIISLNPIQRQVFEIAYKWARDIVEYLSHKKHGTVKPIAY